MGWNPAEQPGGGEPSVNVDPQSRSGVQSCPPQPPPAKAPLSTSSDSALSEAELQYRALVEQSLVGVYLITEDRFLYVNQAMACRVAANELE